MAPQEIRVCASFPALSAARFFARFLGDGEGVAFTQRFHASRGDTLIDLPAWEWADPETDSLGFSSDSSAHLAHISTSMERNAADLLNNSITIAEEEDTDTTIAALLNPQRRPHVSIRLIRAGYRRKRYGTPIRAAGSVGAIVHRIAGEFIELEEVSRAREFELKLNSLPNGHSINSKSPPRSFRAFIVDTAVVLPHALQSSFSNAGRFVLTEMGPSDSLSVNSKQLQSPSGFGMGCHLDVSVRFEYLGTWFKAQLEGAVGTALEKAFREWKEMASDEVQYLESEAEVIAASASESEREAEHIHLQAPAGSDDESTHRVYLDDAVDHCGAAPAQHVAYHAARADIHSDSDTEDEYFDAEDSLGTVVQDVQHAVHDLRRLMEQTSSRLTSLEQFHVRTAHAESVEPVRGGGETVSTATERHEPHRRAMIKYPPVGAFNFTTEGILRTTGWAVILTVYPIVATLVWKQGKKLLKERVQKWAADAIARGAH